MVLWSGLMMRELELIQSMGFMMVDYEKCCLLSTQYTVKPENDKKRNIQHTPGDKNTTNNQQHHLKQGHIKFGKRGWHFFLS